MTSNRFPHLLSPGRIGTMELRNRITVTAMGVNFAEDDGTCGKRIIDYHEEQARGGAAMVNTGVAGVAWPVGGNQGWQVAISEDRFIPGLARVGEAVHRHGAKYCIQLHHGGLVGMEDMLAGRPVWTPSIPKPATGSYLEAFLLEELTTAPFTRIKGVDYKVLTREDIQTVVEQFAAAAARAERAGADAVEIHGGHGYLMSSFLSPYTNRREDDYGGPLENRARFLIEIVRAVRAACNLAILVKIDSREVGKENGIRLEDAVETAKMIEAAGADAITCSSYHDTGQSKLHSASNIPHEPGTNLPAAAAFRAAVGIPVVASGRVEPEVGDSVIREGKADFIAMGRKLLADPHLPRKLAEGRAEDVRPCIYCYTCVSAIYTGERTRCAVNPRTGFEWEMPAELPASPKRSFVVIGGGPGGMESARMLDAAGHRVTLIERSNRLGGTLRFASLAYAANERLLDWLTRQLGASKVDVRLNTEATPELLRRLSPDAVIVATGAIRDLPDIPGVHHDHVFSGDDMRSLVLGESTDALKRKTGLMTRLATKVGAATGATANLDFVRKATRQWMPLGDRIVIVGGELVGIELAEFLAERGRAVTVVDDQPRFGKGLTVVRRMRILPELAEHGVGLFPGSSDIRIDRDAVRFTDAAGKAHEVPADNVIVAKGAHGDLTLAETLSAAGFAVQTVGDARGVGYIEGAMRGAARAVGKLFELEPA